MVEKSGLLPVELGSCDLTVGTNRGKIHSLFWYMIYIVHVFYFIFHHEVVKCQLVS